MDILSGIKKAKRYIKEFNGYKLLSQWTSSQTVEMDDGSVLQSKINSMDSNINKKANINSPTLSGIPKAPTAPNGTNSTQIATTRFVQTAVSNGIAASDAMVIKGTIGSSGTVTELPTDYMTGWTYRVVSPGTYAGQVCEIGDLVIALVDRNGSGNIDSDWCVAQTNINGAITGIKGDLYISMNQTGSIVSIGHKDVTRINSNSTISENNGGSFTVIDNIQSDNKGHITKVNTKTVTLPEYNATNIGALPITGGTLTGDLRIKGDGNFGTKLNFGDGDYVHLYEPEDDCLEIKAKKINFLVSDKTDAGFTLNGDKIGGTAEKVKKVIDNNDGRELTFAYSADGVNLSDITWLAAWSGNELRALHKNAFAISDHTHNYEDLDGSWILHRETISLNYFTAFGVDSLSLKGNSIEIGQHTDVVVLGVTNTLSWLAGWSYSGLTLSINVVTHNNNEASATVCYLTKG